MAKKQSIAERLFEAAEPIAERMGLTLWDTLYVKEGPTWFLRAVIDKEGGVTIDDCEKLSRALDPVVDGIAADERDYIFEVSSPGLARELRTDAHIRAYIGKRVKAKLYAALADGSRERRGALAAFDGETLELEGGERLAKARIAKLTADDDEF